jgi:hypothetical protein
MNLQETNGLLGLFVEYWPTFELTDNKAAAWSEAMSDYHKAEAWQALKDFRTEESRVWAPTISELIGRMDYWRDRRATEKQNEALLLEAPRRRNDFEPLETYTYKTSRTTPKQKKDEPQWEVKKAVRCSRDRKRELLEEMKKRGYIKRYYDLADGKRGSVWVK